MKNITNNQYLCLLGLEVLKKDYNNKLKDILSAVQNIVGEEIEGFGGHSSDFVYSGNDYDADCLLKKLDIKVRKS